MKTIILLLSCLTSLAAQFTFEPVKDAQLYWLFFSQTNRPSILSTAQANIVTTTNRFDVPSPMMQGRWYSEAIAYGPTITKTNGFSVVYPAFSWIKIVPIITLNDWSKDGWIIQTHGENQ